MLCARLPGSQALWLECATSRGPPQARFPTASDAHPACPARVSLMPLDERGGTPPQDALIWSLVDKIPSMTAYWDATLRCRFANRAYMGWFGVTPEWLMGKHISELLGPLYELNRPYIERVLRGEAQEFERELTDPAGGPSRHSLANYIPD